MERTELDVQSSAFVSALEQVLPRHGYRTTRSFDLHLHQDAASQIPQVEQACQCGCGYTVLLVFANAHQACLEGTISVRGVADRSIVSLVSPDGDGSLATQFGSILVEAVGVISSDKARSCCCTHA